MPNLIADITIAKSIRGANGDGTTEQVIVQTSENSYNMLPNLYYNFTLENETETSLYQTAGEASLANEYLGQITTTVNGTVVYFPNVTMKVDVGIASIGDGFTLNVGKTYCFSIVNNLGVMVVYE